MMRIAVSVTEREKAKGVNSPYFKALVAAGALPAELALVSAHDSPRPGAEEFDGILFTGGEDVGPAFYGEKKRYPSVQVNPARDEFEWALLDRALHRRLPILGICRGTQMINVKFGGTLYQDMASEAAMAVQHLQPGGRDEATHSVTLTDSESRLASTFDGSCRVNSMHHQAIKRLGRGLKVTARSSEDSFVEAVEAADDYPFLMAVQWHPEEMVDRPEQRAIFAQFLAQCRERAAQRKAALK